MKKPYLVQGIPDLSWDKTIHEATVLVREYRIALEQLVTINPETSRLQIPEDIMAILVTIEKRVKQLNFDGHQPKIDLPVIHHTRDGGREIMTFWEAFSRFDRAQEMCA